tara:strand:+ start:105 stop:929 length:825 start_codon:yes stop_codon:yes gene_type:complete
MSAPISDLADFSSMSFNNLNLVVKKAIEYVDRMKNADREIKGLSYSSLPKKQASRIRISLKSSKDGKFLDEYDSPETYSQKLTLACFLYSVSSLCNLDKRARILCTNAAGRGDLQMSISTKHCKSKLQEDLNNLLGNEDFIAEMRGNNQTMPENLTPIQKDLINQSTSGNISKGDVKRIKTNHSIDDIELYLELEDLKINKNVPQSQIPIIDFEQFTIEQLIETLTENKIAQKLQTDLDNLSLQLKEKTEQNTLLQREIDRIGNRNLLQRIFNK